MSPFEWLLASPLWFQWLLVGVLIVQVVFR